MLCTSIVFWYQPKYVRSTDKSRHPMSGQTHSLVYLFFDEIVPDLNLKHATMLRNDAKTSLLYIHLAFNDYCGTFVNRNKSSPLQWLNIDSFVASIRLIHKGPHNPAPNMLSSTVKPFGLSGSVTQGACIGNLRCPFVKPPLDRRLSLLGSICGTQNGSWWDDFKLKLKQFSRREQSVNDQVFF